MYLLKYSVFFTFFILLSCGINGINEEPDPLSDTQSTNADVTNVSVTGNESAYTFVVTIKSPDTGCDQYADWWEVISESEELMYRRILVHSHVDEQPFKRSGGPAAIASDQNIWIRAHMNNTGYGGETFFGNAADGFDVKKMPVDFASALETVDPLPQSCAF